MMKYTADAAFRIFSFPVDLPVAPQEMLLKEMPGVCRCMLRRIGSAPELAEFETLQNYAARLPGCGDLALEAEIFLHSANHPEWKSLRIGIPLSEIPGVRGVVIRYTGTYFQMVADERVLDEEFPYGEIEAVPGVLERTVQPPAPPPPVERCCPMHLWSPEGLNSWIGDVSLGYFNGEFHIFYLYDRRHHRSKFGQGGHQWGHWMTRDFRSWRDDGIVLPFEDLWQTFGTGTPFMLDGKLTLAYGIHSDRFVKPGEVPFGATWATSSDGIHFEPVRETYEELSVNPSVYHVADGTLMMYHGYAEGDLALLRARKWPEFKVVNAHVLPSGAASPMRNILDCPAYFSWHGRSFIMVGFTGMWCASDPEFTDKTDLGEAGRDLYDGLEVPMIAPYADDRRILAGWLSINDSWGGVFGIRELCWFDDGIPGIRWLDAAMPERGEARNLEEGSLFDGNGYFDFSLDDDGLLVRLEGEGEPIELRIDCKGKRAALLPASKPGYPLYRENPDRVVSEHSVIAVDHLRNLDVCPKVRMLVNDERKFNGCIIDVEIAGCRTLIHHFPGSHPRRCQVVRGNGKYVYASIC